MSAPPPIKFAIADDHKIFRDGIKMALSARPHLKLLWEAQDGKDMMHKLALKKPDLLLLDIRMPELSGFDVLDVLLENHQGSLKNTAIFVLSSTLDDRDLNKAVSYPIVTKFMSKPLTFEMVSELLSK